MHGRHITVAIALLLGGCMLDLTGLQGGTCMDSRPETCDATDEDCDGVVDEGLMRTCGEVGTCAEGRQRCLDGDWQDCAPRTDWPPESCGGGDEDCDSAVDEGCTCAPAGSMRACGTNEGICTEGVQTCQPDGMWGECAGAVTPMPEQCGDTLDNDCDGIVNGQTEQCREARGRCTDGFRTCGADGRWGVCDGTGPIQERCDAKMVDEDCDGMANEDCECFEGQTQPCGSGACVGMQTCRADGTYGACVPDAAGTPDTCNGLDDDCDGTIDNNAMADCAGETHCDVVRVGTTVYLLCYDNGTTDEKRPWVDARNYCRSFGYHLVTIDDMAENSFLTSQASMRDSGDWWIGYNDEDNNGTYEWVFGMSTFEVFRGGGGGGSGKAAVLDAAAGDWEDKGLGGAKPFICEAVPPTP